MGYFRVFGQISAILERSKKYRSLRCEQIIYHFKARDMGIQNISFVLRKYEQLRNFAKHVFAHMSILNPNS